MVAIRLLLLGFLALLVGAGGVGFRPANAIAAPATPNVAVGAQYDSTHVNVAPADFDRFVASLLATFGGTASKRVTATVTPTPSSTFSQLVQTPVGMFSVFGFQTPIPYPFGQERTGYLVTDIAQAVSAARSAGASVIVAPFDDPIGRDVIVEWPGGVDMQFYWHKTAPSYAALRTIPENRIYLTDDNADDFIARFLTFSRGKIVSDVRDAPGVEIARPKDSYRRVRIESIFGLMTVLVTDGHLPYPYGRELTGYAVEKIADTLARAKAAGGAIVAGPYRAGDRDAAMLLFPGGYIAEIHAPSE